MHCIANYRINNYKTMTQTTTKNLDLFERYKYKYKYKLSMFNSYSTKEFKND